MPATALGALVHRRRLFGLVRRRVFCHSKRGLYAGLGALTVHPAIAIAVVGRLLPTLLVLLLLLHLGGREDAVIVFSMLEIVLGSYPVAGSIGIPRQLQILLIHMRGGPSDFYLRSAGIKGAVRIVMLTAAMIT